MPLSKSSATIKKSPGFEPPGPDHYRTWCCHARSHQLFTEIVQCCVYIATKSPNPTFHRNMPPATPLRDPRVCEPDKQTPLSLLNSRESPANDWPRDTLLKATFAGESYQINSRRLTMKPETSAKISSLRTDSKNLETRIGPTPSGSLKSSRKICSARCA
jgi:hypothetical protein